MRNLIEGLEDRKNVLADMRHTSDSLAEQIRSVKDQVRILDLEYIDGEFARKRVAREWDNTSDAFTNVRRDNIRRADQIQVAQNFQLELEAKKRRVLAELNKAQEFHEEVGILLTSSSKILTKE